MTDLRCHCVLVLPSNQRSTKWPLESSSKRFSLPSHILASHGIQHGSGAVSSKTRTRSRTTLCSSVPTRRPTRRFSKRVTSGFDFSYFINFKDVRGRKWSSADCSCDCDYDFSFTLGVIRTDSISMSESIQRQRRGLGSLRGETSKLLDASKS